mgnify:CR=1 FL=1
MIEAEIRSFLSKEQFAQLISLFQEQGTFINTDEQETYYFQSEHDLRIQKNNFFAKIVLKQGKVHDEAREELEIKVERDQFAGLESLFTSLGYPVKIKWFRTRHTFDWGDIKVMLDYTRGYGYIIELEKMCEEKDQSASLTLLKTKLAELGVSLTERAVFEEKFKNYEQNWKQLTQ